MKKSICILVPLLMIVACYGQSTGSRSDSTSATKKDPVRTKQCLIGSALTIGGFSSIAGGGFCLYRGITLLETIDEDEFGPGRAIGFTVGGCLLLSAGITGAVAGPIVLAQTRKARRHPEKPTEDISLNFTPIQNRLLDKYQCSHNNEKFASFSITF